MKFTPHGYQRYAMQRILDQPAVGLLLSMGFGKTVITLSAIWELMYERFEIQRVLVVAPLRVAQSVWAAEAAKWDHLLGLRVVRVLGAAGQRVEALQQDADVYVINRENVPWLVDLMGDVWPFDMVVLDELSSFKAHSSARFKALRRVRSKIRRIVGLTGTPAPNGLMDLWAQMYLLDRGAALGTTIGGFRQRFFDPGQRNGYVVYNWAPKPEAEKRIYELLAGLCFSMRNEDYLELPPRIDQVVPIELDPPARAAYARLERETVLAVGDQLITAATAAVVTGKLLQMANGAVYGEDRQVHEIHGAKLDALVELIEAANGQPVLVYYAYQHDKARIMSRVKDAVALSESPTAIDDWNAGRIPVMLAHPDSAGHGLNLQAGGCHVIWFGLTWSLEKYQQANARLHRQGQSRPVVVQHLIAQGTMDEQVMRVLAGKELRQDALIDAVKARIEEVRG